MQFRNSLGSVSDFNNFCVTSQNYFFKLTIFKLEQAQIDIDLF